MDFVRDAGGRVLSPKPLPDRSAKEAEIDATLSRIERECQVR